MMNLPRYQINWSSLKKNRLSILMVAMLVVVLIIVHFLWFYPLSEEKEAISTRVEQQEELVQKYQQKLQQAQSIRENLVKQENELKDMQKKLFRGNDPYQLAASLGDLLKGDQKQNLDVKTYQVLASKEYGLYQEVHLRFNFMTNVEGLHYFLERVRNIETSILVQEINIQKIQRKQGPDLVVNVILAALMEKGEKAS